MDAMKGTSDFTGLTVLCGSEDVLRDPKAVRPLAPFDEGVRAMLAAVSAELMHAPEAKAHPEVLTFGFFCRKANTAKLASRWEGRVSGRVGRGVAFHVAPSNVPVNFAYTLVAGLLAGNACIVKASSRDFEQVRVICRAFEAVLARGEFATLRPYVQVVMYGRERQDLTEWLSSVCNVRVIWGGDATIRRVRQAPLAPRATDVCFADRYSLGVINAQALLDASGDGGADPGLVRLAHDFYNDTYLYDQNACTSQRLLIWHGVREACDRARGLFWGAVHAHILDRYVVEPVVAVDKLAAVCRTAISIEGSKALGGLDNRIMRVEIPRLSNELPALRAAGGLFHEYVAEEADVMDALAPLVSIVDEKYQTFSYFGEDPQALHAFVINGGLYGIDRITPIGKTAEFSLVWDGYDLIEALSREIDVR